MHKIFIVRCILCSAYLAFYLMLYQLAVHSDTQINCCKTSPLFSLVTLSLLLVVSDITVTYTQEDVQFVRQLFIFYFLVCFGVFFDHDTL